MVQQSPTIEAWENSNRIGSAYRQNQVIFEKLKAA